MYINALQEEELGKHGSYNMEDHQGYLNAKEQRRNAR